MSDIVNAIYFLSKYRALSISSKSLNSSTLRPVKENKGTTSEDFPTLLEGNQLLS